jgi:hypothetical protein
LNTTLSQSRSECTLVHGVNQFFYAPIGRHTL